ncbi:hypothetical protein NDU88_001072 [Pleurodeles waltl]|uniref:Uncharacterized protein n=1 Tax=Pleurodeles waltl TaxID=8319 RepID=A0AAV7RBW9_PLEWA|nr:hypothetical protein NDU88_001072 [Pleurodeles waltl]
MFQQCSCFRCVRVFVPALSFEEGHGKLGLPLRHRSLNIWDSAFTPKDTLVALFLLSLVPGDELGDPKESSDVHATEGTEMYAEPRGAEYGKLAEPAAERKGIFVCPSSPRGSLGRKQVMAKPMVLAFWLSVQIPLFC